jgi:hypothetical protein
MLETEVKSETLPSTSKSRAVRVARFAAVRGVVECSWFCIVLRIVARSCESGVDRLVIIVIRSGKEGLPVTFPSSVVPSASARIASLFCSVAWLSKTNILDSVDRVEDFAGVESGVGYESLPVVVCFARLGKCDFTHFVGFLSAILKWYDESEEKGGEENLYQ